MINRQMGLPNAVSPQPIADPPHRSHELPTLGSRKRLDYASMTMILDDPDGVLGSWDLQRLL
jgi:hypothetical protein